MPTAREVVADVCALCTTGKGSSKTWRDFDTPFLSPSLRDTRFSAVSNRSTQVAWFALRKLGGASKTRENSLDEAEHGDAAGGDSNTSHTVLTTPLTAESYGDGGNGEPAGREPLAAKAAAPADAGALALAAKRPNDVGGEEDTASDDPELRGVLLTGLGDEEDAAESDLSVPLLPRGSGVQNGSRQPSS